MEDVNREWLPHLHDEFVSEANGTLLDAYVVALEGWRRGLTLRWHVKDSEKFKDMKTWFVDNPGLLFSLSSDEKTHYFFRSRGDLVTNEAVEIGSDKAKTKQIFRDKGIPTPEGKFFSEAETDEQILAYAQQLGYPVVLKPTDGSFGKGVVANITSDGEMTYSIDYVRHELGYKDVIVEKYIPGEDLRLYVVDNEVVGAIKRIPPHVIGDGINSIEALIELKNEERRLSPRLSSCLIETNKELIDYVGRHGYTLNTVPEKGECVFLSERANISLGGDPVDVFDELSNEIKEIAVKALKAVPGLVHGAVDILLYKDEETNEERGYVIELNPTSQLGGILYPVKGKARDVPAAIIDYYFPETKGLNYNVNYLYFDFEKVLTPIKTNVADVIQVSHIPTSEVEYKIIKFEKRNLQMKELLQIKQYALENELNGSINNKNDDVEIIISGSKKNIVQFVRFLKEDIVTSNNIMIDTSNKPMKIGFYVSGAKDDIQKKLIGYYKELDRLSRLQRNLEKKHVTMLHSNSWRLTRPLRKVTGFLKKQK